MAKQSNKLHQFEFDDVAKSRKKFRVRFHSSAFLTREESREGGFDGD